MTSGATIQPSGVRPASARREKSLTQLVAVLCEDGKKIVTASDRMVSTGDMTLAFEQSRIKAFKMSDKSVVLTAGTIHEPDLIREARSEARGTDSILELARILKNKYQEMRDLRIIDYVLRPVGIRDFNEWHQKQRMFHDGIVMDVSGELSKFRLGLELLLCGVDGGGGHLFNIHDPGGYMSFDNLSYCCAGIGNRHAEAVLAWYSYSRDFPLQEALYIAYEAKRRAEMAGGVGRDTDLLSIGEEGVQRINTSTIESLEAIYADREKGARRSGFDRRISEVEVRQEPLEG